MLKNYLKIAFRNIFKQKGYSFINITGLAVGIACSIFILLFVRYERGYDRFHEKADRIYRVAVKAVIGETRIGQTFTPAILTPTFLNDYPEVLHSIRFQDYDDRVLVRYGDNIYNEPRVIMTDAAIFDVFTFSFIKGNPETALTKPNTVVVSEATAQKYFAASDPMNQIIKIRNDNYRITGIFQNMPSNSHFHFDIISSINSTQGINNTAWFANNYQTYILLKKGITQNDLESKFPDLVKRYLWKNRNYDEWAAKGNFWEYYLQPLTDIHLNSDLNGEFEANGNATYVNIFSIIAAFILLIACINYMNLSTARSANRAREVGMRKVVGSTRLPIIRQFLTESILSSLIALVLALVLVQVLLPSFNNLVNKPLTIPYTENLYIIPGLIGFVLIIGILSGSYPSFFLSSFKPVSILKGNLQSSSKNIGLRNGLVVVQFSISIFLFVGTFIVYQQMEYFQNKKLGFDKEHVVVINTSQPLAERSDPFKAALRKNAGVLSVSGSRHTPGRSFNNIGFNPEGKEQGITLNLMLGDYDFLETLKLEMRSGRFFSREFTTDSLGMIINEKTAELLSWEEPIGKHISGLGRKFHVIGVVKDFHYESLHQTVRPMALLMLNGAVQWPERYILVRIQTSDIPAMVSLIKDSWQEFAADLPFEYSFLDDDFDQLYHNEQQTGKVFTLFSFLAIFIACLGLFGLASYSAEQRRKEIGIRKVLGAAVPGIVVMQSKEFSKWVLLANVIAWPVAYFVMNGWLQNFAYRIHMNWIVFFFAGLLALLITWMTVSYQAVKAAVMNPVNALMYE